MRRSTSFSRSNHYSVALTPTISNSFWHLTPLVIPPHFLSTDFYILKHKPAQIQIPSCQNHKSLSKTLHLESHLAIHQSFYSTSYQNFRKCLIWYFHFFPFHSAHNGNFTYVPTDLLVSPIHQWWCNFQMKWSIFQILFHWATHLPLLWLIPTRILKNFFHLVFHRATSLVLCEFPILILTRMVSVCFSSLSNP